MTRRQQRFCIAALLAPLLVVAGTVAEDDRVKQILTRAKLGADSIPGQAEALAQLAWPDDGPYDAEVAAAAREELTQFGHHGMSALAQAVRRVDSIHTADVVAAILDAKQQGRKDIHPLFIAALEESLWHRSADAQRLAIPELAKLQYRPALLACIDAAFENPELMELVIDSLGTFRDEHARYFLADVLTNGPDRHRKAAAESLARIGILALPPLRDAALSTDTAVRLPAIRALLPVAGISDLTLFYDYLGSFPDDDKRLLEAVRNRALTLESLLEQQLDQESASPTPGG